MRKILSVLLSASLLLLATACTGGAKTEATTTAASESAQAAESSAETGANANESIKIAGIVFLEDQFMSMLRKGYEDAAKKEGVEILLANSNNDQNRESEVINTYVAQGVQGIAIAPINEVTSLETLKRANEKGAKIVITDIALENQTFVSGGFTSSQYDLGKQTGEKAREYIEKNLKDKEEINLAIVQFKSLLPTKSTDRVQGFLDQLKDIPNLKVVADQDAWMQDKSLQVVGDMLTAAASKGGIDIVYGANDGGTLGAVSAVKNANLSGKTVVFGIDAAEQQIEMLRSDDDILQAVTGQDPYTMGYKAVELLVKSIREGDDASRVGQSEAVPGLTISRDDPAGIDEFEKNLKEHTQ